MIVITHVFSRLNVGDGVLADRTLVHLERAGVPPSECLLLSLDADSFGDLPNVRQVPGEAWKRVSWGALSAVGGLGTAGLAWASGGRVRLGEMAEIVSGAEAIVGVSGGYLRAGTTRESLGSLLNHVPQLALAAHTDAPSVYLPISVGPLAGPVGGLIGRLLRRMDVVFVRDDSSQRALRPYLHAQRLPDLMALQIGESDPASRVDPGKGHVVLVGRFLAKEPQAARRLRALADVLGPVSWAVQNEGPGRKGERALYRTMGVRPAGPLLEVMGEKGGGVVVSTRLHGALQGILAGWPTIHLSYQRKGWGAYADLGLGAYVHDARTFDPSAVAAQARDLIADPTPFWRRLDARVPDLLRASDRLTEELRRRIVAGSTP